VGERGASGSEGVFVGVEIGGGIRSIMARGGRIGTSCNSHELPEVVVHRLPIRWKPTDKERKKYESFKKLPVSRRQDIEEKRLQELRETFEDILT